MESSKP